MAETDNPQLPRILSANNVGLESKDPKFWIEVLKQLHEQNQGLSWEQLAGNSTLGFIVSRLYQGSFSTEGIVQNFELTHTENSWVEGVVTSAKDFPTELVRRTY